MPSPSFRERPALSRAAICAAALDAIDAEGIDALSIRALASRMGTRPMSLYRHVADKDDILAGVVALLLEEVPAVPAGAGWRDGLRAWGRGFRAVALAHPRAVPLLADRPMTSYAAGRASAERGLEMLEDAGFDEATASLVLRSVARFVVGFSLAGNAAAAAPAPPAAGMPLEDALRVEGYPRLARLVAGAAGPERPGADALFDLSLDALIDGLALRVAGAGCSVEARATPPAGGGGHPGGDQGGER